MNNYSTPVEACDLVIGNAIKKANMPILKMLLLGICAGAFLSLGASASAVAMHDISNVGLARLVCGLVFPVGLMLIMLLGSELFTGNCLMVEGLCEKKISFGAWMKNLAVVYLGNLIGAVLFTAIIMATNIWGYTDGALGAFTIQVAAKKASLPFDTALFSGILCNVLVCGAVLIALSARDVIGKLLGIWFPIMLFVVAGFEHSIANMYYLFAGLFAKFNPAYVDKALAAGLNPDTLANLNATGIVSNLVPVTIGNFIGGVVLGLALWLAYKSKFFNKPTQTK